jgi:WD40 repeat protein
MRRLVLAAVLAGCGPRGAVPAPAGDCAATPELLGRAAKLHAGGWLHQALDAVAAVPDGCRSTASHELRARVLADLGLDADAMAAWRASGSPAAAAAIAELAKRPPPTRKPTPAEAERARLLYRDGVNLRLAGSHAQALRQLRTSYALAPHPLTIAQIALVHRATGDEVAYRKATARALAIAESTRGARARPQLPGHPASGSRAMAFDDAGRLLATTDQDLVRIWDVATGQPVRTLASAEGLGQVTAVDLSPDGSRLASGHFAHEVGGYPSAGVVRIVSAATGEPLFREVVLGDDSIRQVCGLTFLDRDRLMVTVYNRPLLYAEEWTLGATVERRRLGAVAVTSCDTAVASPGAQRYGAAASGGISLHDATGELLRIEQKVASRTLALSRGGSLLAETSDDQVVRVWNVDERRLLWQRPAGAGAALAFDRGGSQLATGGSDGVVRIWDVTAGRIVNSFAVGGIIWGLQYGPEGRLAVSAWSDQDRAILVIHDSSTGRRLRRLGRPGEIAEHLAFVDDRLVAAGHGQAIAANGQVAVATTEGGLATWAVAAGEPSRTKAVPAQVYDVCWSPDGAHVGAIGPGEACLWTLAGDELVRFAAHGDTFRRCLVLTHGPLLLGSGDASLTAWDASGKIAWSLERPKSKARQLTDGRLVVDQDLVDPRTGKVIGAVPPGALSDDGSVVARAVAGGVEILRADDGKRIRLLPVAEPGIDLAWGGTDFLAVVLGADWSESRVKRVVRIWNVKTGRMRHEFTMRSDPWSFGLSPDGQHLLTLGGWPRTTYTWWDARSGEASLWGTGGGASLSRDGKLLLASSVASVFLFDAGSGARLLRLPATAPMALSPAKDQIAAIEARAALGWLGKGTPARTAMSRIEALAAAPDADRFAAADETDLAMYADEGREQVWSRPLPGIRFLHFVARHRLLAVSADRAEIVDARTGAPLSAVNLPVGLTGNPHPGFRSAVVRFNDEVGEIAFEPLAYHRRFENDQVAVAALSPGGDLFYANDDHQLVWGAQPIGGHDSTVTTIAFHGSRAVAATASRDRTVALWDLKKGKRIATLLGAVGGPLLVVSEDGFVDGDPGEAGAQAVLSWRVGDVQLPGFVGWQRYHRPGLLDQVIGSVR